MTSRNAYTTSRFSVPASAGPLLPLFMMRIIYEAATFRNLHAGLRRAVHHCSDANRLVDLELSSET